MKSESWGRIAFGLFVGAVAVYFGSFLYRLIQAVTKTWSASEIWNMTPLFAKVIGILMGLAALCYWQSWRKSEKERAAVVKKEQADE